MKVKPLVWYKKYHGPNFPQDIETGRPQNNRVCRFSAVVKKYNDEYYWWDYSKSAYFNKRLARSGFKTLDEAKADAEAFYKKELSKLIEG